MPVIPPGPGPNVIVLGAARAVSQAGSSVQWGDVPTWALAILALAALTAAVLAYRKQADAAGKLAEQVDLQRDQLKDQQQANARQAEVVDAQLREMQQRAEAYERQQADAITVKPTAWSGRIPGVRQGPGGTVHSSEVRNTSHRPIRNVACCIQSADTGDAMIPACLVGRHARTIPVVQGEIVILDGEVEDSRMRLVRAGDRAVFVFGYDTRNHPGTKITARFTDDVGLHWQIDPDLSLTKLDSRDW
jgi:hypothetical protein